MVVFTQYAFVSFGHVGEELVFDSANDFVFVVFEELPLSLHGLFQECLKLVFAHLSPEWNVSECFDGELLGFGKLGNLDFKFAHLVKELSDLIDFVYGDFHGVNK